MVSAPEFPAIHPRFVSGFRLNRVAFLLASIASYGSHVSGQSLTESRSTVSASKMVQSNPSAINYESPAEAARPQHFQPGQPIDLKNLPNDILNCDECRRRLGLPPLPLKDNPKSPPPTIEPAEKKVPAEAKPVVEAKPAIETKAIVQAKIEPTAKPAIKSLGQEKEGTVTKASNPDVLRVEGVLTSPATQKMEIEILKKQLLEREASLKQFSQMQSDVEKRIDQLVRLNEELAKKDATRQIEVDRIEKLSAQTLQARDLEISNLRADLANVRADAAEKTKRLTDQLVESESSRTRELAKLSHELMEAKEARVEALSSLRKEIASSKEIAVKESQQNIAEQAKIVEAQKAIIRGLEEQIAKAEKVQRDDVARFESLRKELEVAHSDRTKALVELAKRMESSIVESTHTAKKIEIPVKPLAMEPKVADPAKAQAKVETAKTANEAVMPDQADKPGPKPVSEGKVESVKRRAF